MRKPSGRMQPHRCTVVRTTWGTDEDGGRVLLSEARTRNIPSFVQPGKTTTLVDTADQTGYRRVTEMSATRVYFVDDYNLDVHDMIEWTDGLGVDHVYIVVGWQEPGGLQAIWIASCEERT